MKKIILISLILILVVLLTITLYLLSDNMILNVVLGMIFVLVGAFCIKIVFKNS